MEYYERVVKVIDFIEDNLFLQINIDDLADQMFTSKFYFMRIFKALTEFTASEYIEKRRLSEAVNLLQNSNSSILNIALKCGYNSHEAFSRKFKSHYGVSPFDTRKHKIRLERFGKIVVAKRDFVNRNQSLFVKYYIESTPKTTYIGHRKEMRSQSLFDNSIMDIVKNIFKIYKDNTDLPLSIFIRGFDEKTGTVTFFYSGPNTQDGKDRFIVPEGNYAYFDYVDSVHSSVSVLVNDIQRTVMLSDLKINPLGCEFTRIFMNDENEICVEVSQPLKK